MNIRRILLHGALFVATFITCMMAGAQWLMVDVSDVANWSSGLTYAILVMTFLATHEFGHYFAARIHGVDASLPYFIPVPATIMPFGTFGAVIRTRTPMLSRKVLFDIGVSGPIAGFIVCLAFLIVGFATLPGPEYILSIHPEYNSIADIPATGLMFGDSILFSAIRWIFSSSAFIPPMNEVYHYPFLCVGWFGLFVTSLNMLPFGQLDGGHVLYALIGKKQHTVGQVLWWTFFALAIFTMLNVVHQLLVPDSPEGWVVWLQTFVDPYLRGVIEALPWLFQMGELWLLWLLIVRFLVKIEHPIIEDEEVLSPRRKLIGWTAIAILILSFSPRAIYFAQ